MVKAFGDVMKRVGDPLDNKTLYGPLHNSEAVNAFKNAVEEAVQAGGKIEFGGKVSHLAPRSLTIWSYFFE